MSHMYMSSLNDNQHHNNQIVLMFFHRNHPERKRGTQNPLVKKKMRNATDLQSLEKRKTMLKAQRISTYFYFRLLNTKSCNFINKQG